MTSARAEGPHRRRGHGPEVSDGLGEPRPFTPSGPRGCSFYLMTCPHARVLGKPLLSAAWDVPECDGCSGGWWPALKSQSGPWGREPDSYLECPKGEVGVDGGDCSNCGQCQETLMDGEGSL